MESWDSTVLDMQAACEWLVAAIGGRRMEDGGRCCGGMSKLWLRSGDPMLARSSVGIVVVSCELHAGLD
jgi:hypothetical protein